MISSSPEKIPRVGVGVIVCRGNKVLLGKRMSSHGSDTWSFPGGHLEFGETIESCAAREVLEETGLTITNIRPGPYTNDVFQTEGKHYSTLFVVADGSDGEPQILEPEKCGEWRWCEWGKFPTPLFIPVQNLRKIKFNPFE